MCSVCGSGDVAGSGPVQQEPFFAFWMFSLLQPILLFPERFLQWKVFFLEVSCCKDFLKFMGLGFWEIKRGALNSHQLLMFAKNQEATLYVMT